MTKAAAIAALNAKGIVPRGLTRSEAAAYVGLSDRTFSRRVRDGLLPGPSPCTGRWDRLALDAALGAAPAPEPPSGLRDEIEAAIDNA